MTDSAGETPAELDTVEYRLDQYETFLRSFQEAGYGFSVFDSADSPQAGEILLRHDVDLSLGRALAMAECEHRLDIESTYCFLLSAPVYDLTRPRNVRLLQRIEKLGHDIALHFDTHAYWEIADQPSQASIAAKVADELTILGRLLDCEVSTASFHIPPEWVLDRTYDAFVNTYAPPFFSEIEYWSDSSQKWTTSPPFPDGLAERFQLLVHPGLWHADHQPMADIVDERRTRAKSHLDHYFEPLAGE